MQVSYFHLSLLQKAVFLMSFACAIIYFWAMWWESEQHTYPEWGAHIAIVLDVSKSMNAIDAPDISRLQAAKEYVYTLISEHPGYRYGLSIFAGESQRVLPLTQDINLFARFLSWLESSHIQLQGTDISVALSDGIKSFSQEQTGYIVLLTDGGDETIQIDPVVKQALASQDIKLLIVGVWSQKWAYIPTGDFLNPYQMHQGKVVRVKLNQTELQRLAKTLGGKYVHYTQQLELDILQDMSYSPQTSIWYLYLAFLFWILFLSMYVVVFYFPEYIVYEEV